MQYCIVIGMKETQRGPGRPRNPEADKAILDAALELLIERGVEATSIEHIAKRAGVTRATVYRRYPDKTQLLIAAIESSYGNPPRVPDIRNVEEMIFGWSQVLSIPRIRRLLRRLYGLVDDYPELKEAYDNSLGKPREQARIDVLERARDRGQLPPDADADIILQMLTGAVFYHLEHYPDTSTPQDLNRFLRAVLHQIGYRPEGDSR